MRLPAGALVCYKPCMRKWMRERMRRRKKAQEQTQGQTSPAPLQPAYFAGEAPSATGPVEAAEPASEAKEVQPTPERPPAEAPAAGDEGRRRKRRRRGRGGRRREAQPGPAVPEEPVAVPPQPAPSVEALPVSAEAVPKVISSAAPIAMAPAPPRTPKGVVVLAIGLPGSGKSSWFKRHNITPLSSDMLRALLFDDPQEQRFQDLIFSNLRSMLKARLIARRPMNYVDATNLSPHERHSWIKLAKDFGFELHAVFFDVPVEVCMERNQRRQRVVPEEVMRRMAAKLRPPAFEEGFAKITVVRVKKKD